MRIAYTMNGLVGGFGKGKNVDNAVKDDYKYQSEIALRYTSKFFREYIVKNNDVDVFIFSWETDKEDQFEKAFNPKKMKLIPQIDFECPAHLRHGNTTRVFAYKSRWYGFKEVMKLKSEYEKENNFKYDLVVNARFDLCYNKAYDFSELVKFTENEWWDDVNTKSTAQFHIPVFPDRLTYGWPDNLNEILDHIFASSSENMDKFSTLFDKMDEYTMPGQCPQWNTISNHFLMVWHLEKLGLLSPSNVKKSFRTYTPARVDNQEGKTDYDIIRYRNLSEEDILKELENEY